MIGRLVVAGAASFLVLGAPVASAHPLGNFSINHSHNLMFEPQRIIDRAIVDFAEIPTAQSKQQTDADGDGRISADELGTRARTECEDLRQSLHLTVDAVAVPFTTASASFAYEDGQAGLPTGRLECRFEAAADLTRPRAVSLSDGYQADRVGWHEIAAIGDGVQLVDSAIPQISGTDELRNYPLDLLGSPLDVREVALSLAPGTASSTNEVVATAPNSNASIFHGGPLAGALDRITGTFNDLVGRRDLTLGVGLLAVTLAMILGATHALLPGHGKTVMAAYIAGRQGSARDAVMVGATVTATHTGGVLLLGLALTVSSSLAGESVLGWLGVVSGLIITTLGAGLLTSAARHRTVGQHAHSHRFGHGHHHHHEDHHKDHHDQAREPRRRRAVEVRVHTDPVRPGQARIHDGSTVTMVRPIAAVSTSRVRVRDRTSARHDERTPAKLSRRGLIGMGIAGGLVPSPSALIVLLSAIALGRTIFGVVLVIGYGAGMAATLTLAGLLLVRVRDRLQRRERPGGGRTAMLARRWSVVGPYATASLVLVVGLGIAVRGVSSIVG